MSDSDAGRWVGLARAAHQMRKTYPQVYNLVLSGKLAADRVDGRWMVAQSSIETYLLREQEAAGK